jgi:ABC-type glycerol-3-phosphate transport system permease component
MATLALVLSYVRLKLVNPSSFAFLQTTDLHTITIAINELFEQYYQYYQTAFAGFFLSMIPMVILFLFLQKCRFNATKRSRIL